MSCLSNAVGSHSRTRAVAIACALLLGAGAVRGENRWQALYNVRIENVTVAPSDARNATITFDISWPESWRDKTNHDAAWVFFKARASGATEWQHVRLAADKVLNPTGYGQAEGGTPLDFIVPGARVAARASDWGILGLSDNMGERAVTVGNAFGRRFAGTHGDGAQAPPATEDELRDKQLAGWHGLSIVGIGHRGGGSYAGGIISKMDQVYENLRLRTSDRSRATGEHPSLLSHPREQYCTSGFRFVRTAP